MTGFKYVVTSVVWNLVDNLFYTAPERSGAYRLKHQGILKLILDTFPYVLAILRQTVLAVQISPLLKEIGMAQFYFSCVNPLIVGTLTLLSVGSLFVFFLHLKWPLTSTAENSHVESLQQQPFKLRLLMPHLFNQVAYLA